MPDGETFAGISFLYILVITSNKKEVCQVPSGRRKNAAPTMQQDAYLIAMLKGGKTQREAYRDAYPSSRKWGDRTVDAAASRLMSLDYMQARYEDLQRKLIVQATDKGIMTAVEVLQEVSAIAKSNIGDYLKVDYVDVVTGYEAEGAPIIQRQAVVQVFGTDEIPRDKLAAVSSIKQGRNGIEIKLHDKVKAAELLGKHHKVFEDAVKHEHTGNLTVEFAIPRPPAQPLAPAAQDEGTPDA